MVNDVSIRRLLVDGEVVEKGQQIAEEVAGYFARMYSCVKSYNAHTVEDAEKSELCIDLRKSTVYVLF